MKIEAGKHYRTREGKRVFVASVNQNPFRKLRNILLPDDFQLVLGFLEDSAVAWSWSERGRE